MKVLVCGGRNFINVKLLYRELDALHEQHHFTFLIHGNAAGADILAKQWARSRDIPSKAYPADWDEYGKAAGPIRNSKMLSEGKPDIVVAFEGGVCTADMASKAKRAGVEVVEIKED